MASSPGRADNAVKYRASFMPVRSRKLRCAASALPPQGMPRPDEATVNRFTDWLETSLDKAAAADPEPGRSTLHRLNGHAIARSIAVMSTNTGGTGAIVIVPQHSVELTWRARVHMTSGRLI